MASSSRAAAHGVSIEEDEDDDVQCVQEVSHADKIAIRERALNNGGYDPESGTQLVFIDLASDSDDEAKPTSEPAPLASASNSAPPLKCSLTGTFAQLTPPPPVSADARATARASL